MAFTCTENFDSYSVADELNGKTGGSANWLSGWSGTVGKWSIQTAPAGGQGGLAAKNTTVDATMVRNITSITAGTVSVRMQTSITNPTDFLGVVLKDSGGTNRMYVRFGPDAAGVHNIEIYDGNAGVLAYVSLGAYSANTWYIIDIDFDTTAQPNLYRARVNGGAYSSYKTVDGGSYANIHTLLFDSSAPGTRDFWIDDIRPGGVVLPRPIFRNQAVHRAAYW